MKEICSVSGDNHHLWYISKGTDEVRMLNECWCNTNDDFCIAPCVCAWWEMHQELVHDARVLWLKMPSKMLCWQADAAGELMRERRCPRRQDIILLLTRSNKWNAGEQTKLASWRIWFYLARRCRENAGSRKYYQQLTTFFVYGYLWVLAVVMIQSGPAWWLDVLSLLDVSMKGICSVSGDNHYSCYTNKGTDCLRMLSQCCCIANDDHYIAPWVWLCEINGTKSLCTLHEVSCKGMHSQDTRQNQPICAAGEKRVQVCVWIASFVVWWFLDNVIYVFWWLIYHCG